MKRFFFLIFSLVVVVYLIGCAQKKKEEEFLTMDELGAINLEPATVNELKPQAKTGPVVSEIPPEPAPTIPPPPTATIASDKPGIREIQTALKNAGYYIGEVDGKSGRLTKKAIEDFQEANSLEADGKVGLKTWAVLSKYLTAQPAPVKKKR
jgi:peptidoglycan hydrolase-like protein with peptidoglycan-binding domain